MCIFAEACFNLDLAMDWVLIQDRLQEDVFISGGSEHKSDVFANLSRSWRVLLCSKRMSSSICDVDPEDVH